MKLNELKIFEQDNDDDFIRDESDVRAWLKRTMKNYKQDFIEFVDGKVNASWGCNLDLRSARHISKLPVEFRTCMGRFDCAEMGLNTLEGCPEEVHGHFNCNHNKLDTLKGAPKRIYGDFMCNNAGITTLEGVADYIEEIQGILYISDNSRLRSGGIGLLNIKGLKDIQYPDAWHRKYYDALDIIKKYLGKPDDFFECQAELLEAGLEEYAKL